MKTTYIYLLFILSLTLISCNTSETNSEEKSNPDIHDNQIVLTKAQFEQGNFALGKLDSVKFSKRFRVTGMIDVPPENRAAVSTFFEGYVSKTTLLIGDKVNKGDLLVTLENPEFINLQQSYTEKFSELEFLEAEFIRKSNLFDDQVISEKVFQKAKSDYRAMKGSVAGLEKTLEMMNVSIEEVKQGNYTSTLNIYAPISGKISKLNISQGMFVNKSTMIMEILDTDHIHLELDVFEKDIMKINQEQPLTFSLPEQNNKAFKAHVKLIGAEVNSNRTVKVHAHPDRDDESFAVGMFVEAYFDHQSKTEMGLPSTAFVEQNEDYYILKLVEETGEKLVFEQIAIETNDPQEGFRPVLNTENVSLQDTFLTKGAFDIIQGDGGGHDH